MLKSTFAAITLALALTSSIAIADPLTIGDLSATAGPSTVTISLSAPLSGGANAGYSYKIWRDTKPFLTTDGAPYATTAQFPYIDSNVQPRTTYYYKVIGSDSSDQTVDAQPAAMTGAAVDTPMSLAITTPSRTLLIVYIGDSITAGIGLANTGSITETTAPYWCDHFLTAMDDTQEVYGSNVGRSGFTTVNWLPSVDPNSCFAQAEAAAKQLTAGHPAGQLIFSIMLGTNDSATHGTLGAPVSDGAFKSNMSLIAGTLLKDFPGCKVVIHDAPYYTPNTYNFTDYREAGLARLVGYRPVVEAVAASFRKSHRGQVFVGDTAAYAFFQANYAAELNPEQGQDGTFYLHPNETGAIDLAHLWAIAISNALASH